MFFHKTCSFTKIVLAAACVGSILSAGCKTQEVTCNWAPSPIQVDGKSGDWKGMPVTVFEEEGVVLALANDADKLYIQFRTRDMKWVRTIRMFGLTVYVSNNGKDDKDFFVSFKGGPNLSELGGPGSPKDKNRVGGDTTMQFTCYQKGKIIEKPIPVDGMEGPAAAYDTSFGFYTYEISIPLSESMVRNYGIGAEPGQAISIGVEWGGMGDFRGKRPGGMGGERSGGGRPPGGGMGSRGMRKREMPEKQEVWLKTELAVHSPEE